MKKTLVPLTLVLHQPYLFFLLPQNQKESNQSHLGNLNYILYYFDEKMGVAAPSERIS